MVKTGYRDRRCKPTESPQQEPFSVTSELPLLTKSMTDCGYPDVHRLILDISAADQSHCTHVPGCVA